MSLIFCSRTDDPDEWRAAFAETIPDLKFRIWPDVGDVDAVEVALVWDPMQEHLLRFPNLKLIASLGAGVDHLLATTTLPDGVPMTRIVDDNLTQSMREYVLLQTLYCHRQAPAYMVQQRAREWRLRIQSFARERRVGIMGLGVLGAAAADALQQIGFPVSGWSRRQKTLPGVAGFAGLSKLDEFLAATDILICLLPHTPDTEGIINSRTLSILPVSPNSIIDPVERGEATAAISAIGNSRSARMASISRPTFPVAPTTAMVRSCIRETFLFRPIGPMLAGVILCRCLCCGLFSEAVNNVHQGRGQVTPADVAQYYRPRTFSKPTTSPGCFTTSRMQRTTPGM